jgi:hypothetical protein
MLVVIQTAGLSLLLVVHIQMRPKQRGSVLVKNVTVLI